MNGIGIISNKLNLNDEVSVKNNKQISKNKDSRVILEDPAMITEDHQYWKKNSPESLVKTAEKLMKLKSIIPLDKSKKEKKNV